MKSLPWGNLGNFNLKGKLSKAIMAGKYVEDEVTNLKQKSLTNIVKNEMILEVSEYYDPMRNKQL